MNAPPHIVGRLVVRNLLDQDIPVRALVRDKEKAQEVFAEQFIKESPKLDLVVGDIARWDEYENELDQAVNGCAYIISVMGVTRFSKLTDFLPWRLLQWKNSEVARWADRDHPYYGNYMGHRKLIELAERYRVQRFVRLTGLALAYPAYHPICILFNTLLSLSNRWNFLCEQALAQSSVPYVILRPGGLADDERNMQTTNVQVSSSGKLPFPGRCGRKDVADLAVAALAIPQENSYTLACRWCGQGVKPRPQGIMEDGFENAEKCIEQVIMSDVAVAPTPVMRSYGFVVGITVYSLLVVFAKVLINVATMLRP